jgi:hypothetical protein
VSTKWDAPQPCSPSGVELACRVQKSPSMSGSHDLLAHYTFSIPAEAVAELRLALPPEIVALLDWSSLRVESSIVVDSWLRRTEKDIVYSIQFLTGESARILVLFEHLSTPSRWVALRMLDYVVRYLVRWHADNPKNRLLPAIFPVVLYSGAERPWRGPPRVEELFALPGQGEALEFLRSHTVRMGYQLDNLFPSKPEEVVARQAPELGRLTLYLLRYGKSRLFAQQLPTVTELIIQLQASPEGAKHLAMLLDYLSRLKDQRAYENARLVLHSIEAIPPTEDLMKSYAEELEDRGRQSMLTSAIPRVLASRGVNVDDWARQLILSCTNLKLLDQWFERALSATTLSDVFGELRQ